MDLIIKPYNINIDTGSGISETLNFNNYNFSSKYDNISNIIISIGNNILTQNNVIIDELNTDNDLKFIIVEIKYIYSYLFLYIHNKNKDMYKKIYKIPKLNIITIDEDIDIVLYKNRYELQQNINKVKNKLKYTDYPNKDILFNKLNNININELDNQRILIILENLKTRFNL